MTNANISYMDKGYMGLEKMDYEKCETFVDIESEYDYRVDEVKDENMLGDKKIPMIYTIVL